MALLDPGYVRLADGFPSLADRADERAVIVRILLQRRHGQGPVAPGQVEGMLEEAAAGDDGVAAVGGGGDGFRRHIGLRMIGFVARVNLSCAGTRPSLSCAEFADADEPYPQANP